MKKCGVFEILGTMIHGGYTTNGRRTIQLMSKSNGSSTPAALIGFVPSQTFDSLEKWEIIVITESASDKYGTKHHFFVLADSQTV
jgi:hypothetical protein